LARTDSKWETLNGGTAIQTINPAGYDILINGTSKYLNFNSIVGSSGYGFRDNNGVMEVKNSGGAWGSFGGASIGGTITGGTANSILFVNPTATIAQSADFTYNDTTKNFNFGSGVLQMNKTISGASSTSNFLNITATLPTVPTAGNQTAVSYQITTSGSALFEQRGFTVLLGAGYTGSSRNRTAHFANTVAGTGVLAWQVGPANYVLYNSITGTTTGNNVGNYTNAGGSSSLNLASYSTSNTASAGNNVAIAGFANNGAFNIGGLFSLQNNSVPTINQSAAIIANNGSTTSPIFIGQVNGTEAMRVTKSGNLGVQNTDDIFNVAIGNNSLGNSSLMINASAVDGSILNQGLLVVDNTYLYGGTQIAGNYIDAFTPNLDSTIQSLDGTLHLNYNSNGDVIVGEGGGALYVGNSLGFFTASSSATPMTIGATITSFLDAAGMILSAGSVTSGSLNKQGGDMTINAGGSTGNGSSNIKFFTATAGASGTTQRAVTQKMIINGNGNVGIGTTTPTTALDVVGTIKASATIRLPGYTVATLPTGTIGDTAYVTDALAPTFLATIVGGGAVKTPCFFNGTNWVGY